MATETDRDRLTDTMNKIVGEGVPTKLLCGFLPLEGNKYQRGNGLMVFGRAIYKNWGKKSLDVDHPTPKEIGKFVDELDWWGKHDCDGNVVDEMAWVNEQWGHSGESSCGEKVYNTRRSAFWRVIKEVLRKVDQKSAGSDEWDSQWASQLTWSNLYKISAGGNPTGYLKKAQRQGCIDMLKAEFAEYRPSKVLFLTGKDWAKPFLDGIEHDVSTRRPTKYVEASGSIRIPNHEVCVFVVAKHPQGKPEGCWVEEVLGAFKDSSAGN